MWTSDRRLYLDKAGEVVEQGDPTKVTLLVAAGGTLSRVRAHALGLIDAEGKALTPKKNKARTAPANK